MFFVQVYTAFTPLDNGFAPLGKLSHGVNQCLTRLQKLLLDTELHGFTQIFMFFFKPRPSVKSVSNFIDYWFFLCALCDLRGSFVARRSYLVNRISYRGKKPNSNRFLRAACPERKRTGSKRQALLPYKSAKSVKSVAKLWKFTWLLFGNMLKYPPVCQKTNASAGAGRVKSKVKSQK